LCSSSCKNPKLGECEPAVGENRLSDETPRLIRFMPV